MKRALRNVPQAANVLLITGTGKFFSYGLDIQYFQKHEYSKAKFFNEMYKVFAALLVFRLPTIAVINGHAFGAGDFLCLCNTTKQLIYLSLLLQGMFLAISCDYRIMRTEKGYLCIPAIDLGTFFDLLRPPKPKVGLMNQILQVIHLVNHSLSYFHAN